MRVGDLCLQTWLAWGAAASLPFLLGRNPFPMAMAITAVVVVNQSTGHHRQHGPGWRLLARGVALFSVIAVVFNVLTVRAGDREIFTFPDRVPLIDGAVTWNAVIYGLLAAAGVLGLVLVWTTVGGRIHWSSVARLLPERLVGVAVAGSSAINLVPQTAAALTDIREAAIARGYAPSGVSGARTILTPMINVGLDRSMHLAELLEARGFGASRGRVRGSRPLREIAWTGLLGGSFIAAYGLLSAIAWAALCGAALGLSSWLILMRGRSPDAIHRTRYREQPMQAADWIVMTAAAASAIACMVARELDPGALIYEPYPGIEPPAANLWLLVALFGLFAPALVDDGSVVTND